MELEDENNYGKIYKIILNVKKIDEEKKDSSNNTIEKVEIEVGSKKETEEEKDTKKKLTSSELKELKEYLSNTYDVQEKDISIE